MTHLTIDSPRLEKAIISLNLLDRKFFFKVLDFQEFDEKDKERKTPIRIRYEVRNGDSTVYATSYDKAYAEEMVSRFNVYLKTLMKEEENHLIRILDEVKQNAI